MITTDVRRRPTVSLMIVVLLGLLVAACGRGGVQDAGPLVQGPTSPASAPTATPASATGTASPTSTTAIPTPATVPTEASPTASPSPTTPAPTTPAPTTPAPTTPAPTTPAPTTPAPSGSMAATIYLLREPTSSERRAGPFVVAVHRVVPETTGLIAAAVTALLASPTSAEASFGLSTAVPAETALLGVDLDDGLVTIDLTGQFESGGGSTAILARLAQLVFTATQFHNTDRVQLLLDGAPVAVFSGEGIVLEQPLTRADFEDQTPALLLESPAFGATLASPAELSGVGAAFEATFYLAVLDADGNVLAQPPFVMTDNGTGWGQFAITLDYTVATATTGFVRVWAVSAADGSIIDQVDQPVVLLPA